MTRDTSINAVRAILLGGAASLALSALPAHAQDTAAANDDGSASSSDANSPSADDAIVVTGTFIQGIQPTGSPVVGLGRTEIEDSTSTTTTQIISELPQVFNFGANEGNYGAANNQAANVTLGTGISLRGLGTSATLTLLDSRRLPPAGTQGQFFDPSVIPAIAVQRVEVLPDGSSGIYGSDAVGGVVNIMLRKNFTGAEFSAEYGVADDLDQIDVAGIVGQSWGSGSLMVAGEYYDRDNLAAADRPFYTDDMTAYGGPDLRPNFSNPGTIVVGGTTYAIPAGQDGTNLQPSDLVAGTQNKQTRYVNADVLPSQRRHSFAAVLRQDVTNWLSFTSQGFYSKRKGAFSSGPATATLTVPSSNPFFVNPANPDASSVDVRYAFNEEFEPATRRASQEVYYVTNSLRAEIAGDWSAELFLSYGKDKERSTRLSLNTAALNAALADPDPATAFNPFGEGSNTPQSTLDKIYGQFRVDTDAEMLEYGGIVDGTLFQLPGGSVKTAFGASRIEEDRVQFTPSYNVAERAINSVFGELYVPLFGPDNAVPGIRELSIQAALRYDDYTDYGSTTNPKIGVSWKPVDALTIRGSYGTSFRAPQLVEHGDAFIVISDFVDPTAPGGISRVLYLRGPNPSLGPETATTWSVGGDFAPASAPGLKLSVTYFNVDYTNRIQNPNISSLSLVNQDLYASLITYNPTADEVNRWYADPGFNGVPEDPSNIDAIVDARKANLSAVQTDGIEGNLDYRWTTGDVAFRAGVSATYLLNYKQSLTPGAPIIDLTNTVDNPLQFKARAYVGATVGDLSGTIFVNHAGGYKNTLVNPEVDVDSYTLVDLSLRYGLEQLIGANASLTFKVQNLFDQDPPYVQYGTLAYDPNVTNPIGRMFLFGVKAGF